jgi:hypothetical protein
MLLTRRPRSLMTHNPVSVHTNRVIERVLELSADAQIKRRQTDEDAPAFHQLTGAIAAYGNTLRLLARLQQQLQPEDYLLIGCSDADHGGISVNAS